MIALRKTSFTLYVGVRFFWGSFDKVKSLDIDVWIDSMVVTQGREFPSPEARKAPDSFALQLAPGTHRLRAVSDKGEADFEIDFELSKERRFADLSLNYYPKDSPLWIQCQPETNPEFSSPGFEFESRKSDFGWR